MQKLPPEALKFALNAAQDTLPHNANLAIWRRSEGLSSNCKLCGERQTLVHVLNHCQMALDLRRYNARHDAVLEVIDQFVIEGELNLKYILPSISHLPYSLVDLCAHNKSAVFLKCSTSNLCNPCM